MIRIEPRQTDEQLKNHDSGYSVFDVGSRSVFIDDRIVVGGVLSVFLSAAAVGIYVLAVGTTAAAGAVVGVASQYIERAVELTPAVAPLPSEATFLLSVLYALCALYGAASIASVFVGWLLDE